MNNPFKFGSVVSDEYFTNREVEYENLFKNVSRPDTL